MSDFTPLPALLGGVLIGAAASLLLLGCGRVAGVCGIVGSALEAPGSPDAGWRRAFVVGLVFAGLVGVATEPAAIGASSATALSLVTGGLLVGFGTRLANGCTSGHGVCGLGRGSARSLVATCTFMLTGGLTVYLMRHLLGPR